jgi:glycosyltransferase involved in cell wall biosynthesis
MKLHVLFRSCSRVYAVHGNRRVVNASKSEIIIRCLNSVVSAMRLAGGPVSTDLRLSVVDDHSDPQTQEILKALIADCPFETEFISMTTTGNGASLLVNYELARNAESDLIYFIEDDYMHTPSAIREMLAAHQQISFFVRSDVVLHPSDDPRQYLAYNPTGVVLSETRYWRNIFHTTATTLISRETLLRFWDNYMGLTHYSPHNNVSEDNTINLIYKQIPCFSPMPALAVHLADSGNISPFVDWVALWKANEVPHAHQPTFSDLISP